MIKKCILLLMFTLCSSSIVKKRNIDDIFNLDPDEIFASKIGEDLYAARKRLRNLADSVNDTNYVMDFTPLEEENTIHMDSKTITKAPNISTTERIDVASIPPEFSTKQLNITVRQIKLRRVNLQLETMLNSNRRAADYIADSDIDTLTKTFDEIVEKNKINIPTKTRREQDFAWEDKKEKEIRSESKRRLRDLCTHFVYITRYQLSFAQLLRKKYYDSSVYRIGFLFGLVRHLKSMQKWLYWSLQTNGYKGDHIIGSRFFTLKMVEKLQRLDVDIKDVVLLIKKCEYKGNIESNPKYYDYSLEKYDMK